VFQLCGALRALPRVSWSDERSSEHGRTGDFVEGISKIRITFPRIFREKGMLVSPQIVGRQ
jgi:hypothetical protein